jgi:ribosomal protein S27E
MAILDLDKIVFNRTIIGIVCEKCGGNLKQSGKAKATRWLIRILSFGKKKARCYECENCKTKYLVT